MKQLILVLFLSQNIICNAQRDTITSNVKWPLGLESSGNYLFIAEADGNSISKIDYTKPNQIPIPVVSGLFRPNFLQIVDNLLYFTEYDGNEISFIDITQMSPIRTILIGNLNKPKDLLIVGSMLYYTEPDRICKLDLSLSTPVVDTVLTKLNGPVGLAISGNELYYSEYLGESISKIDITTLHPIPTLVIGGLQGPLGGMTIKGNDLYFEEYAAKRISKVDITSSNPSTILFKSNIGAADILFIGNSVFVSDFVNSKIYRYTDIVLSLSYDRFTSDVSIYPIPANNDLFINSISEIQKLEVYASNGQLLESAQGSAQLNISGLRSGIYVIRMHTNNGIRSEKFTKE